MIKIKNDTIQSAANQFARLLDASNIPTRGVVNVLLPNCREYIYCLRGTTWSGRTFTPINWHLKTEDIEYIIQNSEACALIVHADFAEQAKSMAQFIPAYSRFVVGGELDGYRSFNDIELFSNQTLEKPLAGSIMMYTSGTTGRPKGVKPASPKNEAPPCSNSKAGAMLLQQFLGEKHNGPHLVAAPLYHVAPSTYAEGAALLDADIIIMEKWDAEAFLRIVEKEKIVSTFLVPTHFVRLLRLPEETRNQYDLTSLKFICHGAAPVSQAIKHQMIEWLGPVLFEFYGGTEGGGISISSQDWLQHPGSVGKPRPDQDVSILDDDGQACATGTIGNIYFKASENRFEYKGDPDKTASAYIDDKYTLGDMGYLDADGYLYLSDRKADTIISGGVNIYPAEIEAALLAHPAISDCCVVGVNDTEWGERVVAAIQLLEQVVEDRPECDLLLEDIAQHCRQTLAGYQQPKQFIIEQQLPRTDTGKLQRRKIRDAYRLLYNNVENNQENN